MKKLSLANFVENPKNPSRISEEDFEKFVKDVRENPIGLTADRIAYVTDMIPGKCVVLQGNKRLRALKRIYGDDGKVPENYFHDITGMTSAERNEFIVDANVIEGEIDYEKALKLYSKEELADYLGEGEIEMIEKRIEQAPKIAEENENVVEFKLTLTSDDYEAAVLFLRADGSNMEKSFMEVIRNA